MIVYSYSFVLIPVIILLVLGGIAVALFFIFGSSNSNNSNTTPQNKKVCLKCGKVCDANENFCNRCGNCFISSGGTDPSKTGN